MKKIVKFEFSIYDFAYGLDSSPTEHFAYWTVHLLDISPTGHFAHETLRLLDSSPTGHFAYTSWRLRLRNKVI